MTVEIGLIKAGKLLPTDVFKAGGTESIIKAIEIEVEKHVPDISDSKGRKAIASLASKVSKSKTFLDSMGKKLKAEYKIIIDPIDAERKTMRESLDTLRDKARKPLTEWETKQEELQEAERKQVEFDLDFDVAIAENTLFNREQIMRIKEAEQSKLEADRAEKEQAEKAEKDRLEYETKIKADAEAKAKKDTESALLQVQEEKERLIQEAKQRENQVKIDAENAEKKAANINHQKAVNNRVLEKLVALRIPEAKAKEIIMDILQKKIPEITINY